jgi:hypothetical protein
MRPKVIARTPDGTEKMRATINMGTEDNPVYWGFIESAKEKSRILNLSIILSNNPTWILEKGTKK